MLHLEAAVAVEAGGRGVKTDRFPVAGADEVAERAVRVAADRDDPRDRGDGTHGTGDGEDATGPVEREVVEAAGRVPVDPRIGLQVVVDQDRPVDDEQRLAVQAFDPVTGGRESAGHLVEVVGEPGHRHPAEVGAHHGLVPREGVRARVAERGPARGNGQMGAARQVRVRVDKAEPERPEHRQAQRAHESGPAVVEYVSAGVGVEVAGAQGARVGHGADAESVDDDDDGLGHEVLLTGLGHGRRTARSAGGCRRRARRRRRRSSG